MFSANIATQDGILISPNVKIGFRYQAGSYDFQHLPFDSSFPCHVCTKMLLTGMTIPPVSKQRLSEKRTIASKFHAAIYNSLSDGTQSVISDDYEEDQACPVDCVREFKTDEEFLHILEKAKQTNSLVVVDFYRTSCGSCKYIEQGFRKLCKGAGDHEDAVIFLKHNVLDEYDEQSEVAERLRIKTVPLFHFYKDGALLEAFATRDKERILAAISKYSAPVS